MAIRVELKELHSPAGIALGVSSPGGQARQYRVQTLDRDGQWHLFASFRRRELAEQCLEHLRARDVPSRLVSFNICPAAA